ncbi:Xaa-Pro aminopeptidase [Bryocella elongata]|uniref:Xaa-Pro aminopeptidase n=1 Tax=Bryocella elongata TaxID=863522 RepID=A0A1H5WBF6_9BACT|nr:M24 family metallopeptidase [Bryocella elongata]SEF96531.1 Xaa-Pro aminopeptidase [Bryocella elongata]
MKLHEIQAALRDQQLDGWLFYDHHHRDPIAYRILGLDEQSFVSRRWFYFVPAEGEPKRLVHRIESGKLDAVPGTKEEYSSWQELELKVQSMLEGSTRIAMQYSPRNAIMYVSMVDAGTVEMLRAFGKDIVSSANLVSLFEAVLTEDQIASHFAAQQRVDRVLQAAWQRMGEAVRCGHGASLDRREITEREVVNFILEGFEREGLFPDHGPNCSAGPNSADSHYEPTVEHARTIRSGDFVLIDLWAKLAHDPNAVWYDITWTGVVDREPTEREQHIFTTVASARDAAIQVVEEAFLAGKPIAGWQADAAARAVITNAGYGPFFTHRTGHNIAVELHGNGAHLDNLETHDERLILPNTCFSVEPGLYFNGEFGIRSEVNMIARPGKAVVSGPIQRELVRI